MDMDTKRRSKGTIDYHSAMERLKMQLTKTEKNINNIKSSNEKLIKNRQEIIYTMDKLNKRKNIVDEMKYMLRNIMIKTNRLLEECERKKDFSKLLNEHTYKYKEWILNWKIWNDENKQYGIKLIVTRENNNQHKSMGHKSMGVQYIINGKFDDKSVYVDGSIKEIDGYGTQFEIDIKVKYK